MVVNGTREADGHHHEEQHGGHGSHTNPRLINTAATDMRPVLTDLDEKGVLANRNRVLSASEPTRRPTVPIRG